MKMRRMRKMWNPVTAGLCILCLLTACAGNGKNTEPEQTGSLSESEELEGSKTEATEEAVSTDSVETAMESETGSESGTGNESETGSESETGNEPGGEMESERKLHVNVSLDSDREEARIYEAFLRGETKAAVGDRYYENVSCTDPLKGQESISFQEILENIWKNIKEIHDIGGIERVEYALIDCGSDGVPELAVRAYGLSIHSLRDDSDMTMIFGCADGKAELLYAVDTWARRYEDIYTDGFISGGGSGGAMTHYSNCAVIGADGIYRPIYDMHIETGRELWGMSYLEWDEEVPVEFYECQLGEDKVYAYYMDDTPSEQQKRILEYIAENEKKMKVKFITSEELDKLIDARAERLGAKEMMQRSDGGEAYRIKWQTLDGCEDYLYQN